MKKVILLVAAAAVIATASAATLSPEQAMQRARANASSRQRALNATEMKLVHTTMTKSGEAAAYLFTREGDEGFSILSANDVAIPVLGYSNSGKIDPDNMPPALKWWLDQYAAEIEYAEENGLKADTSKRFAPEGWTAIEPLITTKWDQGAPYNNDCPKLKGAETATGCVATSMAQAMNYFKYPEIGIGSIGYTWESGDKGLFLNFAKKAFDWDNMLDTYSGGGYTDEQAAAVSYLMKACGYSVQMDYNTESGAISRNIAPALITYFGYDANTSFSQRDQYSYDEWAAKCYNNIKNVGPVIYNGNDPLAGGHSFICDGYDGEGYFHINWGWSGMSDGYFSLDSLTPITQGAGGAEGGFNYYQGAVFGMQKPTGEAAVESPLALTIFGETTATISGKTISFSAINYLKPGWCNYNSESMSFQYGAIIEPVAGGEKQTVSGMYNNFDGTWTMSSNSMHLASYSPIKVTLPTLSDGKYKVTLATRLTNDDNSEYVPMNSPYNCPNYVYAIVENGKYSVEVVPAQYVEFKTVELTAPLYRNRNTRMKAHIVNNHDVQLTACITPYLTRNGKTQYSAETIQITLDPNSEKDYEWVARFYEMSGADDFEDPSLYTLDIHNQANYQSYGEFGTVEMSTTSSSYSLKSDNLSIQNYEKVATVEVNGNQYSNVYVIDDSDSFTADFTYHVSRGYFDSTMTLCVYRRGVDGTSYVPVTDLLWESTPFLTTNESESVTLPIVVENADPNTVYYLRAEYVRNNVSTYLSQVSFMMPNASGVENIAADTDAPVQYYNLQGIRVANPEKGELLIKRQGAQATKVIF